MRWLVPGAVLLSGWLAIGVAPALAGREALSGILAGNPAAGSALFASRGCIRCHAVLGDGGVAGPDLGRLAARGPLIELAGIMWNHSVRMDAGAGRGTLEAEQMAHLVAFLYSLNSLERSGDPAAGARLFATKGCRSCHALGGAGGDVGPRLDKYSRYASPLFLTAALWEHGPAMAKSMRERGVRRPTFAGADIADLMAFIRASGSSPGRVYARPGNPARGEELFAGKRCAECHAVRGEGGRVGPDLGERGRLGGGLVQIAGTMWNHGPAMWAKMAERGIEVPALSAGDMSDLINFLYWLQFIDAPGDPARGKTVFGRKGCAGCHALGPGGREGGPPLAEHDALKTPLGLITAMWNHRTPETRTMLQGTDLADLVAYVRSGANKAEKRSGKRP